MLMPTLMTFRFINTSVRLNPPSYWNRWRTASPESKPGWPATDCALIPLKRKSCFSDLLVIWCNALLTLCSSIQPVSCVCDLGVVDQDLFVASHVSHVTSLCFFHLRQLRLVRRSLTIDTAHALVWALIHSRLDYCNGVFAGLPAGLFNRLHLYFRPLRDSSSAYQAVCLSCQQSVIRFIGLVILSVSRLNFA